MRPRLETGAASRVGSVCGAPARRVAPGRGGALFWNALTDHVRARSLSIISRAAATRSLAALSSRRGGTPHPRLALASPLASPLVSPLVEGEARVPREAPKGACHRKAAVLPQQRDLSVQAAFARRSGDARRRRRRRRRQRRRDDERERHGRPGGGDRGGGDVGGGGGGASFFSFFGTGARRRYGGVGLGAPARRREGVLRRMHQGGPTDAPSALGRVGAVLCSPTYTLSLSRSLSRPMVRGAIRRHPRRASEDAASAPLHAPPASRRSRVSMRRSVPRAPRPAPRPPRSRSAARRLDLCGVVAAAEAVRRGVREPQGAVLARENPGGEGHVCRGAPRPRGGDGAVLSSNPDPTNPTQLNPTQPSPIQPNPTPNPGQSNQ